MTALTEPCRSEVEHWPFATHWPGVQFTALRIANVRERPVPWRDDALLQAARLTNAAPKRRDEFLAGRRCAQAALGACGVDAPVPRATDGAPMWPPGVIGAITHGAGWAAALVSRDLRCRGLGVDVEACLADDGWTELAPQFLLPRERRLLIDGPPALVATLCFSFKESLMKAVLPRLSAPLDFLSIEVLALDHMRRQARLSLPAVARVAVGEDCEVLAQWAPWPVVSHPDKPTAVMTALQLRSQR